MTTLLPEDPIDHDVYLREALRHAPDAQAGPSPALSEMILSEARAKARSGAPAPAQPKHGAWATLWSWLVRPSVATGFAGVMAATLVGMMWWGRPIDDLAPRQSEAPVALRDRLPNAEVAPPAGVSTPPAPAAPAAPPVMAKPSVVAAPEAEARRDQRSVDRARRKEAVPSTPVEPGVTARATATAAAPVAPPVLTERESQTAEDARPLRSDQAAAAKLNSAPMSSAAALAPPPAGRVAAVAKARSETSAAAGAPVFDATTAPAPEPAKADAPRAALKARSNEQGAQRVAEKAKSLSSLRAQVAVEPARWAWQRGDGGAVHSMDAAVMAWLTQLDDAVASSGWEPASGASTSGRELRLLREGRVMHTLRLGDHTVRWEHDGGASQAVLGPDALAALRAALESAAP